MSRSFCTKQNKFFINCQAGNVSTKRVAYSFESKNNRFDEMGWGFNSSQLVFVHSMQMFLFETSWTLLFFLAAKTTKLFENVLSNEFEVQGWTNFSRLKWTFSNKMHMSFQKHSPSELGKSFLNERKRSPHQKNCQHLQKVPDWPSCTHITLSLVLAGFRKNTVTFFLKAPWKQTK